MFNVRHAVLASLLYLVTSNIVLEITTEDQFIQEVSGGLSLVEFYAPWCGHCQRLEPIWNEAAVALNEKVRMMKVDCTVESNQKICKQYHILGYPTIMSFNDGIGHVYEGGRTLEDLLSYEYEPSISVISSEELSRIKENAGEHSYVVGFFPENDPSIDILGHLGHVFKKDHIFHAVTNLELAKQEGLSGRGVIIYKPFDEKKSLFEVDDQFNPSEVQEFIRQESYRLFTEMTSENYKFITDRGLPIGWLFVKGSDDDNSKAAMELLSTNAHITKNKMSLVWMDGSVYPEMAQRVGLSGSSFPSFSVEKPPTENHPFSSEGTSLPDVIDFIKSFL